jgi:hypothetical protein
MKAGYSDSKLIGITAILILLISGCGIMGRKDQVVELPILTVNRVWEMHQDINFVYFYYRGGSVESGLLLKWEKDLIKIQKKGRDLPETIPSAGIATVKVVVGNRIWESLPVGAAVGAGYFFLVKAYDLAGQSAGSAFVKMFGAPLIIIGSIAYGAGQEKTETYQVPHDFRFDYEEIKRLHKITG